MKESLIRNLRVVYARTYVRVRGGAREMRWLFAEMTIPLLSVSAYVFMYKALLGTQQAIATQYIGFVIVGGAMLAFWVNVLWNMSAQFYWEKEVGNLDMYLVAPISRMAVLAGMALGGMVNTTLRALIILIVGAYLYQATILLSNIGSVLLIFFLTLIALYALGMLFASLFMLYGREAWNTAQLLQEPVQFLSGFYFPVQGIGWLYAASSILPVTWGLIGLRSLLILGKGFADVWQIAIILTVFILILIPLARFALSYMENLGKREGRLTLRWQ